MRSASTSALTNPPGVLFMNSNSESMVARILLSAGLRITIIGDCALNTVLPIHVGLTCDGFDPVFQTYPLRAATFKNPLLFIHLSPFSGSLWNVAHDIPKGASFPALRKEGGPKRGGGATRSRRPPYYPGSRACTSHWTG